MGFWIWVSEDEVGDAAGGGGGGEVGRGEAVGALVRGEAGRGRGSVGGCDRGWVRRELVSLTNCSSWPDVDGDTEEAVGRFEGSLEGVSMVGFSIRL